MSSWAAVLGEGSRDCANVKLDITKASENGGFLIGKAKGLPIYVTKLSTSLRTVKEDGKVNVHKSNCRS